LQGTAVNALKCDSGSEWFGIIHWLSVILRIYNDNILSKGEVYVSIFQGV